MDYYQILGLTSAATQEEIGKAYHALALKLHPDRTGGDADAAEEFKKLTDAYRTLADPDKKNLYDARFFLPGIVAVYQAYLKVSISNKNVGLNGDVAITYRYPSDGRVLKRPFGDNFIFTSGPVVDHYTIFNDGVELKETSLIYTIAPLKTGHITIAPAVIYIQHKPCYSEAIDLIVNNVPCYFTKNQEAGSSPYIVHLHKEQINRSKRMRTYVYRRMVLVPRSDYAYYYHQIGKAMKVIFIFLGLLYGITARHGLLLTIGEVVAGSLTGGLLCQSMYLITGVKSRFYYAMHADSVQQHLNDGYRPGQYPGLNSSTDTLFYYLKSVFV